MSRASVRVQPAHGAVTRGAEHEGAGAQPFRQEHHAAEVVEAGFPRVDIAEEAEFGPPEQ